MGMKFCCPYIRSAPIGELGLATRAYCVLSQEYVDRETLNTKCYTNSKESIENCPVYKYKDFTEPVEPEMDNNGILR